MDKKKIKEKASLSWSLEDYRTLGEEAPQCLFFGKTEGESLTTEMVEDWVREEAKSLLVLSEEYPDKFEENYRYYLLDLEYLYSLGKIAEEEYEELKKRKNVSQNG